MQELINPLIDYQELTKEKEDNVKRIGESVEILARVFTKVSLEYWVSREEKVIEFRSIVNELLRDSVKLTLYGELLYYNPEIADKNKKLRHWTEYLIMAARGYQKIFETSEKYLDPPERFQLKIMAVAEFHNAMQHACSSTLAKEAVELLYILKKDLKNVQNNTIGLINFELYNNILKFFRGDFKEIVYPEDKEKSIDSFYTHVKQELSKNKELTLNEVLDLSCILYLVKSINLFSDYMLKGDEVKVKEALGMISKADSISIRTGRADLRYLSSKLKVSIETLQHLSFWKIKQFFQLNGVKEKKILNEYIKSKIDNGFYFMYPSQFEALKEGILKRENNHTLVSMPTGAGKTLLAEFIVLAEMLRLGEKRELAIYMVPSRALAREKFGDFTKAFGKLKDMNVKVCQITGEVIINDEEAVKENDLIIVTPEKFDMILRNKFYGRKVDTLIVDEFHNIRTGFRGIRIEFDIIRQRELYPSTKIVLISAIVSNFSEIKNWLKADKAFRTTWRPTFSRIGMVDIGERTNKIKFNDGSLHLVSIKETVKITAYIKYAAKLAVDFGTDGPCMIFSPTKKKMSKYIKYLLEEIDVGKIKIDDIIDKEANKRHSKRLFRLIGDEEIYRLFIKGIGIHKGDLPHQIRRIIEDAFQDNALRFLISTTTLAEGINLPIKTIIIPKPKVGRDDMDIGLFFNLLGRAGRPNMEYEGQVVLIASKSCSLSNLDRYFTATQKDIEEILTPVRDIMSLQKSFDSSTDIKNIEWYKRELDIQKSVLDTVLLAIVYEGKIIKIKDYDVLIDKIVIGSKKHDINLIKSEIAKTLSDSEDRLIKYNVVKKIEQGVLQPTDFGKAVYKTGFSPESCKILLSKINSIISLLEETPINRFTIFKSELGILRSLLELMPYPIETRMYFPNKLPPNYINIIYRYMLGHLIKDIAQDNFDGKISESMIQVQGLLSGFSAWFLYALEVLIEYKCLIADKKTKVECRYISTLKLLPEYAWFGTNNDTALGILKKDISRELLRDDVLRLIEKIGEKDIRKILKNPKLIYDESVKTQINEIGLQTEEDEFIKAFYHVLSKR